MELLDHTPFHHPRQPVLGLDLVVDRPLTPEEERILEIESTITDIQQHLANEHTLSRSRSEEDRAEGESEANRAKDLFGRIVELTYQKSYGLAVSTLGPDHKALAIEALQESYGRAFNALPRFKRKAKFETWLYRIVVNRSHTARVREEHHAHAHVGEIEHHKTSSLNALEGSPEHAGMQLWQNQRLVAAINLLDEKSRQVVVMHDMQGLTYDEIVELLGGNENQWKVRRHRALQKIKVSLADMGIASKDDISLTSET